MVESKLVTTPALVTVALEKKLRSKKGFKKRPPGWPSQASFQALGLGFESTRGTHTNALVFLPLAVI